MPGLTEAQSVLYLPRRQLSPCRPLPHLRAQRVQRGPFAGGHLAGGNAIHTHSGGQQRGIAQRVRVGVFIVLGAIDLNE